MFFFRCVLIRAPCPNLNFPLSQFGFGRPPYRLQKKRVGSVRIVAKVPINDPNHWRERAEEARTVADELTDPDSKRRMLRIADDYEELARSAEKRLAAPKDNHEWAGTVGGHAPGIARARLATGYGTREVVSYRRRKAAIRRHHELDLDY